MTGKNNCSIFWFTGLMCSKMAPCHMSERDEDSWVQSWVTQLETINDVRSRTANMLSQTCTTVTNVAHCSLMALFGSMNPKSTCVFRKRYRMHNHRVKSIVPPEKLLVYTVRSRLLGASICAVPLSQPIPVKNYF